MNALVRILKEQATSFSLILRLAAYETKSKYQMNYLGVLWQLLNPLIQMLAYWFVFGIGLEKALMWLRVLVKCLLSFGC